MGAARRTPPAPRAARVARRAAVAAAVSTKTVRIGTRGSPLALAQAYLTRDLLKVWEEGGNAGWLSVGSPRRLLGARGGPETRPPH